MYKLIDFSDYSFGDGWGGGSFCFGFINGDGMGKGFMFDYKRGNGCGAGVYKRIFRTSNDLIYEYKVV